MIDLRGRPPPPSCKSLSMIALSPLPAIAQPLVVSLLYYSMDSDFEFEGPCVFTSLLYKQHDELSSPLCSKRSSFPVVEPAERMVAKPRRDSSDLLGQRSWDPPSPMPPMLCKGVQAQGLPRSWAWATQENPTRWDGRRDTTSDAPRPKASCSGKVSEGRHLPPQNWTSFAWFQGWPAFNFSWRVAHLPSEESAARFQMQLALCGRHLESLRVSFPTHFREKRVSGVRSIGKTGRGGLRRGPASVIYAAVQRAESRRAPMARRTFSVPQVPRTIPDVPQTSSVTSASRSCGLFPTTI